MSWPQLCSAHDGGRFDVAGGGTRRHLIFEDGTIWFTEAFEHRYGASYAIPPFVVCWVAAVIALVIAVADGLFWWRYALAAVVLITAALTALIRASGRQERAARAALRLGLFLRKSECVVFDETGLELHIPRAQVVGIARKTPSESHNAAVQNIHLVLSDGESIGTAMKAENDAGMLVLARWVTEQSE